MWWALHSYRRDKTESDTKLLEGAKISSMPVQYHWFSSTVDYQSIFCVRPCACHWRAWFSRSMWFSIRSTAYWDKHYISNEYGMLWEHKERETTQSAEQERPLGRSNTWVEYWRPLTRKGKAEWWVTIEFPSKRNSMSKRKSKQPGVWLEQQALELCWWTGWIKIASVDRWSWKGWQGPDHRCPIYISECFLWRSLGWGKTEAD